MLEKKIEYLFTKKLPARSTVKEKQNLILECILSDPRPMVIWSKNGETIEVRTKKKFIFGSFLSFNTSKIN